MTVDIIIIFFIILVVLFSHSLGRLANRVASRLMLLYVSCLRQGTTRGLIVLMIVDWLGAGLRTTGLSLVQITRALLTAGDVKCRSTIWSRVSLDAIGKFATDVDIQFCVKGS